MKITDILSNEKYSISFEVFPPATGSSFESIKRATEEIAKLKPSFMSVTCGAGGGVREHTLDTAENLSGKYGMPTLAHLTCVGSSKETMGLKIAEIKKAGVKNILALRGDFSAHADESEREKLDYKYAADLIRELKNSDGDFCIGGACYPEMHPESANQKEDIKYLKEKIDAGCDFLVTQMFFDNNLLYNFLYKIREAGITVPVIPGIMPITNAKQVKRASELSGSTVPQRFKAIVDKFGSDPLAMKQAGIAYATDQIIDLYANNLTDVHVYSMNNPVLAETIQKNLSDILGKDVNA